MTTSQNRSEATGWDEGAARAWIEGGTNENEYLLAWRLAVAIAAEDAPRTDAVILDAASGPGGFLAVALQSLPQARGLWFDNFATMESEARQHLSDFNGRVDYRIGDLVELETAAPPSTVSLLTCSRATHHLEGRLLDAFYAKAFSLLRPSGWIANLDSVTVADPWRSRLSAALRELSPSSAQRVPGHPKGYPHTLDEHIDALSSAGFIEAFVPWRFCQHVLVMARKPD